MPALLALRDAHRRPKDRIISKAWPLRTDDQAPAQARPLVREMLARLGFPAETVHDAVLMISELVTNAVAYGEPPVELVIIVDQAEVVCQVIDQGQISPSAQPSLVLGEHGRGLAIVRTLSEGRYGWYPTLFHTWPEKSGKAAWFALPRPSAASESAGCDR